MPLLCHFIVLFLPKPEPQNVILDGIKMGCVPTTQPLVCSESVRRRKTRPDVFEALSQVPAAARTAASRRSLERQMEATGQRWRLRGRLEIQIQPAEPPPSSSVYSRSASSVWVREEKEREEEEEEEDLQWTFLILHFSSKLSLAGVQRLVQSITCSSAGHLQL